MRGLRYVSNHRIRAGRLPIPGFHDAQVASATSIGVNFTATSFGGGPYPILPNESAGIVPQQKWNNTNPVANGLTADIASPVAGNVVDSTGAVTGANVVWLNANSQVNSSGGNTTPNERLYRGTIEGLGNRQPAARSRDVRRAVRQIRCDRLFGGFQLSDRCQHKARQSAVLLHPVE